MSTGVMKPVLCSKNHTPLWKRTENKERRNTEAERMKNSISANHENKDQAHKSPRPPLPSLGRRKGDRARCPSGSSKKGHRVRQGGQPAGHVASVPCSPHVGRPPGGRRAEGEGCSPLFLEQGCGGFPKSVERVKLDTKRCVCVSRRIFPVKTDRASVRCPKSPRPASCFRRGSNHRL